MTTLTLNSPVIFTRTALGTEEAQHRTRKLNMRLRAALLMVNGIDSVETMVRKFHGLPQVPAFLQELEKGGYIAPVAPKAAAPRAAMSQRDSFDQTVRTVVSLIHDMLGPDGDMITEKLENIAEDMEDGALIMQFLEKRREMFDETAGKQKSADFFEIARNLLVSG